MLIIVVPMAAYFWCDELENDEFESNKFILHAKDKLVTLKLIKKLITCNSRIFLSLKYFIITFCVINNRNTLQISNQSTF